MELPDFPDVMGSAPLKDILDRLLETIAWEELALAALLNAEGEKIQAVVKAGVLGPVDADDVVGLNRAVAHVLDLVVKKEELLRKKLNILLDLKGRRSS